jgi:hypothetical protein
MVLMFAGAFLQLADEFQRVLAVVQSLEPVLSEFSTVERARDLRRGVFSTNCAPRAT